MSVCEDELTNTPLLLLKSRSIRFEAIVEAGSKSRYMALYSVCLEGMEGRLTICDLLMLNGEGLICRLENCFDASKCPKEIVDAGAATIAAFNA